MRDISRELVASLLPMERALELTDVSSISIIDYLRGVREANRAVTERVKAGESILEADFVAHVHRTLADHVGSIDAGAFNDAGKPKSWSWSKLVNEGYRGGDNTPDEVAQNVLSGGQVYLLIALAMNNHLPDFGLTVGWLIMNGYVMSGGGPAVVAPEADSAGWAQEIRWAIEDSETLRGRIMRLTSRAQR